MKGKLRFLGTGNSTGVPTIGCHCAVCESNDPHNKRTRPGALLMADGKQILIDASQDYRYQALKFGIEHLDGVIFTHPHYDHIAGLDDLRIYYLWSKKAIPCLLSQFTADDIQERYDYIFKPKGFKNRLLTKMDLQVLEKERGETQFLGLNVQYTTYVQADMPVTGFRFGDFAYITDIREYPETIFVDLLGVKTLVISALKDEPTPLHFGVQEACTFAKRVGATQTWITHIGHDLDHRLTNQSLPKEIQLAHDGLEIEVNIA